MKSKNKIKNVYKVSFKKTSRANSIWDTISVIASDAESAIVRAKKEVDTEADIYCSSVDEIAHNVNL